MQKWSELHEIRIYAVQRFSDTKSPIFQSDLKLFHKKIEEKQNTGHK